MRRPPRKMALTQDLVARAAGMVEDAGPSPGTVYMTDEDYEAAIGDVLADAPSSDIWLYGYGSLLWKPGFEYTESRIATVRGWHRTFCFRAKRFRGTPDKPGLMLALDRGGACKGMVFKLPAHQVRESLNTLFRRELVITPSINLPRWMTTETHDGPVRALGFVVNRTHPFYCGKLPLEETASILATAAGHWGSCAEYLRETVLRLEELGIHDGSLWRLQALVAERLEADHRSANSQRSGS